jgi:hypothetical protein
MTPDPILFGAAIAVVSLAGFFGVGKSWAWESTRRETWVATRDARSVMVLAFALAARRAIQAS